MFKLIVKKNEDVIFSSKFKSFEGALDYSERILRTLKARYEVSPSGIYREPEEIDEMFDISVSNKKDGIEYSANILYSDWIFNPEYIESLKVA